MRFLFRERAVGRMTAHRLATVGLPLALVLVSLPLLGAAVLIQIFDPSDRMVPGFALAGGGAWAVGMAWGLLVNRRRPVPPRA
jgi:hypothetical protein